MEQKRRHDRKARPRSFRMGDPVFVKNFGAGLRWLPGEIIKRAGPVSFRVRLEDGRLRRYHQDQLRQREVEDDSPDTSDTGVGDSISVPSQTGETTATPPVADSADTDATTPPDSAQPSVQTSTSENEQSNAQSNVQSSHRYPRRNRKPRQVFDAGTKWEEYSIVHVNILWCLLISHSIWVCDYCACMCLHLMFMCLLICKWVVVLWFCFASLYHCFCVFLGVSCMWYVILVYYVISCSIFIASCTI